MTQILKYYQSLFRGRLIWLWLAAYLAGALAAERLSPPSITPWLFLVITLALLFFALHRRPRFVPAIILAVLFGVGIARGQREVDKFRASRSLLDYAGGPAVRVIMRVDDVPRLEDDYEVYIGEVEAVESDGGFAPARGRMRLAVKGGGLKASRGDRVLALASLGGPHSFRNPGGYDYAAYLARRGVAICGYTTLASVIESGCGPLSMVDRLRNSYIAWIHDLGGGTGPPVMAALLAGDRESLPSEVSMAFTELGLAHLLSVSGLHLGLIGAAFFYLFSGLAKCRPSLMERIGDRRAAALATIPVVIAYALVTGMRIPTQRALVMALTYLAAVAFRREKDTWNALALGAMIILFFWPKALYEESFRLSFVSLVGILYALPRLFAVWKGHIDETEEAIDRLGVPPGRLRILGSRVGRYLGGLLAVSVAAYLALLPLLASMFHVASPWAPLFNLAAVPVFGLVIIPVGLLASLPAIASPDLGSLGMAPVSWLAGFFTDLFVEVSARIDVGLVVVTPRAWETIFWYAGLVMALEGAVAVRTGQWWWSLNSPAERRRKTRGGKAEPYRRRGVVVLAIGLLLSSLSTVGVMIGGDGLDDEIIVAAIEVGQGQSILVRTAEGRYLLVDGGGFYQSDFDVGGQVVAPCLLEMGIVRLDAVVLTHPHPDHGRGLYYFLENFRVDQFWHGPHNHEMTRELARKARSRGIIVREWRGGEETRLGEALVSFLDPGVWVMADDFNNQSLVMRIESQGVVILLTGDIEEQSEVGLVSKYGEGLGALVMTVPHHGSRTSSTSTFIEAVKPRFALVSAGGQRGSGLPAGEVLDRYVERGVELLRTDTDGFTGVMIKDGRAKVIRGAKPFD